MFHKFLKKCQETVLPRILGYTAGSLQFNVPDVTFLFGLKLGIQSETTSLLSFTSCLGDDTSSIKPVVEASSMLDTHLMGY